MDSSSVYFDLRLYLSAKDSGTYDEFKDFLETVNTEKCIVLDEAVKSYMETIKEADIIDYDENYNWFATEKGKRVSNQLIKALNDLKKKKIDI